MFGPESLKKELNLDQRKIANLVIYADLLKKWQKSFNLISNKTIEDMWFRHFYDSAQLLELVETHGPKKLNKIWLDLGSGAGFPGLVIAILGGGRVHLVESNGKKCAFMRTVIREIGVDALVHNCRIEDLEPFNVDIITSRALKSLEKLLDYSKGFVSQKQELWYHKGQDVDEELTRATKYWKMKVDKYPSQTDKTGTILRLRNLSRVK